MRNSETGPLGFKADLRLIHPLSSQFLYGKTLLVSRSDEFLINKSGFSSLELSRGCTFENEETLMEKVV
jgi:hypothetical protein